MRCCLQFHCTSRSICAQLTARPSIKLTTIRTCFRIGGKILPRLCRLVFPLGAGPCNQITVAVVRCLLLAALFLAVVRGAALGGMLSAMGITAAKRTTQIAATRVAGMSQKVDPTMAAALQAAAKLRPRMQTAAHNRVVPQNKVANLTLTVPVRPELKTRLDLYCKKDRSRITMPMQLGTSPSYSIDTSVSSGRTGTALSAAPPPWPNSGE